MNLTDLFTRVYRSDLRSPIPHWKLQIVAWYYVAVLLLSLLFNSTLILIFHRYRKLLTPLNVFVFTLTVINLIGSILEFLFIIPSTFACKWVFGHLECIIAGFIMYFVGCSSIYLMAAISIERYYIFNKISNIKNITMRTQILSITFCLILGLLWPILPLFGWSHYTLDSSLTTCTVDWTERSFNVVTYNITIFSTVFVIPFIAIIFTNLKLFYLIKNKALYNFAISDKTAAKQMKVESKITVIVIFYIGGFLLTWLPYGILSLYVAFINPLAVPSILELIPSIIAKSSMVWNTIFYIFSNKNIYNKISVGLYIGVKKFDLENSHK